MKKILLLILTVLFNYAAWAQTGREVSGVLKDSTGVGIVGASIKLATSKDSMITGSNMNGSFSFKNVKSSTFTLTITTLGYQTVTRRYVYNEGTTALHLDPITLKEQSKLLNEIVISGTPTVTIKEDTVEYRASDYKLRENALAEDLLKKLPGVEVDKDGNVTAQGKSVTKVRVNGKDFFGGDLKAATQNLPADIIDKIQLVDDYGDQANLTGVKNGDPDKVLNIQIRPDKNRGYMSRGTLGGGNKERYQANLNVNTFNNTQQISFLGNLNNTNSNLFNFGGGGMGGMRVMVGGGGGGGGRMGGGGFSGGGSDGITLVGSMGLNYRDEWGKKVSSYGSYSFSHRDNSLISNQLQQNNFQNTLISNDQNNNNNTLSTNHRFNWNLEYRPDSVNYIKFSPTFNYSQSNSNGTSDYIQNSNGTLSSKGLNANGSDSKSPSLGANLLLNHRFAKRGRNASLNLSVNNSNSDRTDDQLSDYTNYSINGNTDVYRHQQMDINNQSLNTGANFTYNEPLSRTTNLELNYNFNYTKYNNDRETFDLDQQGVASRNDLLSKNYDYFFMTNRLGVNYRVNQKKYNYTLGLSVQPTLLEGNTLISNTLTSHRNRGFNFIPVARYSYNFSRTRSFNASYFGRSNEPSYTQLQPTPDVSNPQYPVYGNPNLGAEFNHMMNVRYNNFDFNSGNVVFTSLSASYTENRIVSNIVRRQDPTVGLVQETHYVNTDGFYTVNGFYNFSKPFAEKKYVFSLNGSANYNNNVSFSDYQKNIGRNWILSQGFNVQINPAKWLEVNPGASYSYNKNTNSLVSNTNTEVSSWGLNMNSKTYLFSTWLVGIDFSKTFNNGYSSNLATDPFIMNTYLEKQFFKGKTGSLRLQAYDLFDQNTSVSRNVTANSIIDSRSNRLSRYFMLSFTMRLQKFNGQANMPMQQGPGQRMEFRGGSMNFH